MIHTFLRSIGFGDLTKNADLYLILESILNRPDEQNIVKDEYGNEFACFSKSFGTDIGITVCGNFINDKEFRMEYYYPYLHGSQITTCETIEIERHAAREAFAGICDELKLGVTLIFYIENIIRKAVSNLRKGIYYFHIEPSIIVCKIQRKSLFSK